MRFCEILFSIFAVCLTTIMAVVCVSIAEEVNVKVIRAARIESDELPVIDGKLDDECWEKSDRATDFIQFEPVLGAEPRDSTNVYVLFDRQKLYVGFECFKEDPDQVMGTEMERDSHFFQDDYVEVFLDTYHDHRNCYGFAVNCLGTQCDRRIANEGSMRSGGPRGDRSRAWDCAWEAKAAKTDGGWTAEMAIPFSELRFSGKGDGIWGINFWRANEEFDEENTWADVGEKQYGVSRFGHLVGLTPEELVASRPLEFKPYATVKPSISSEWEAEPDAGLDIRYPSTTVTADFTFNPDFAQIEADPEEINLEDVERRLPEKRPFFQEGMELFQTPIELFYTRRVGLEDLVYGAKAVGKLGDYNIAILNCQSDDTVELEEEEEVEEVDETDQTKNNYLVFRTQRDVGTNSSIGFIGVNKQKADGYNRMGGVDLNMTLPGDVRLMGQYAGSWLLDGEMNLDKRDDAFIVSLNRRTNALSLDLRYGDVGPDFEAESGFIERIDRRGFRADSRYEYRRDARVFRSIEGDIEYERLENHSGIKTNEAIKFDVRTRLSDFFISVGPERYYHVSEDDESIFYTDKTISSFTGWFPPRWASVRMRTVIGEQEDKRTFFIGPELSITPIEKLKLEFNLERLDRKGERLELNRRIGFTYQFSHQMFFRSTFEKTRVEEGERRAFALYGWEFRPESHFFLVYTDNKEGNQDAERMMFVKISCLLKWSIF
jgi:hypothetical protein